MTKQEILVKAIGLVSGPRADSYGDFGEQMGSISGAFNAVKGLKVLEPSDVALILMLLKLKRLDTGWDLDSAVDLAGYAALTGDFFCNKPP